MRPLVLCGAFLALATALGCGKPSPYPSSAFPVSGRVLGANGEPVRGGAEVLLVPKAKDGGIYGKEGSGPVSSAGTFTLIGTDGKDGVPGGFYVVVVRPFGAQNTAEKQAASRTIPKKYWSEDTSDMTVEIKEAKTGWDIKLDK